MNTEQILTAIGAIYDTALNPSLWPDALEQTADSIGARISLLGINDAQYPEIQLLAANHRYGNNGAAYLQYRDDPQEQQMLLTVLQQPPQSILRDTDLWNITTLQSMPIVQFLESLGVFHRCGTLLCKHRGWLDSMVFGYAKGRAGMSQAEEQQLQLLLPHLARSVEIQRPLSILRHRFNAVMSVLDRLHVGVAIVRQNGEVILHNRAAERVFSDSDGLSLAASRRLLAQQAEALYALIDKVIATANTQGHSDGETMAVPRRSGKTPYILEIAPLRDSQQEIETHLHGAMMFIIDPDKSDVVSIQGLAMAYQLSEAEQDVCQHMINGLSNADIAEQRDVGQETVKTQVTNILSKTNTRSRSELIHLALKISPPIDRQNDTRE